ncbi:MAG: HD domain-containing protein [Treponema sp.]|nr:HD domain-containing protein [Treponema sp.]
MKTSEREQKLQTIIETEKILNEIQDVDVLLERLLTEARGIVRADAGSIYVVDGENLKIKYAQNDTQLRKLDSGDKLPYVAFSFPITNSTIAGSCVVNGEIINIKDAYHIPEGAPYSFNKSTDVTTGYRTKSMLTLPLKMANGRTLGVLQVINAQDEEGNVIEFDKNAELYITHFATNATQALEHAYLTNNMIMRMQRMAEFRDPRETGAHVERVSDFAIEIYDRWALNHNIPNQEQQRFRDMLKIAAKCHDLGKVGVSDKILKKVSPRFDDRERAIMMGHTCIGALLFTRPESPLDEMARDVCLYHHEWWDGSDKGYPGDFDYSKYIIEEPVPKGKPLKGEEIPLAARIVALADVFDALSHKRVYKEAWSIEDTFMEIQNLSGLQFDPEVVLAFMQVKERILAINSAKNTTN